MLTHIVLTFIGDDRPGLVEAIADKITTAKGNWMQSRMSQLEGKFAGIVSVDVPEENVEALRKAVTALSDLRVTLEDTKKRESDDSVAVTLIVTGSDREGIVKELATILSNLKVNIIEMDTLCHPAPMSSEPLFEAIATITLPESLSQDDVQTALEALSDDLMVDFE